jgi:hypothetical protein
MKAQKNENTNNYFFIYWDDWMQDEGGADHKEPFIERYDNTSPD